MASSLGRDALAEATIEAACGSHGVSRNSSRRDHQRKLHRPDDAQRDDAPRDGARDPRESPSSQHGGQVRDGSPPTPEGGPAAVHEDDATPLRPSPPTPTPTARAAGQTARGADDGATLTRSNGESEATLGIRNAAGSYSYDSPPPPRPPHLRGTTSSDDATPPSRPPHFRGLSRGSLDLRRQPSGPFDLRRQPSGGHGGHGGHIASLPLSELDNPSWDLLN